MIESTVIHFRDVALVFGLQWFPLLGGSALKTVRRRARQFKATHFVLAGDPAPAVGLAGLSRQVMRSGAASFSAAQSVAGLHTGGTASFTLSVGPGKWWFVGVHEGAVIARTDIFAANPQEFDALVQDLRRSYPRMLCFGPTGSAPDFTFDDLARMQVSGARLQAASVWRHHRFALSGRRGPFIGLLCVLLLLALAVWWWMSSRSDDRTAAQRRQVQAFTAWDKAQHAVLQAIHIHGVVGSQLLLKELYQVKVDPGGWRLTQVDCRARANVWRCEAYFKRDQAGADSRSIRLALGASSKIRFIGVDAAVKEWSFSASGLPLDNLHVASASDNDADWLSAVQRVRQAFARIHVARPSMLVIQPPHDKQGQLFIRPVGLPTYQVRSLRFDGPLRSFGLLLADMQDIRWSRVQLKRSNAVQPTVARSELELFMQGELYETTATPS